MTNYDDESVERELAERARRLSRELAVEVRLDAAMPPPPPEDGQILDELDMETRASWNLKRIRQALGLSQQQISDRLAELGLGIRLSQSQIAKIERGERPWRLNELYAIAEAMGVDAMEFYADQNYKDDPELTVEAARLRLLRASEEEERAKEAWLAAARKTYEAEEIVVRAAADLGIPHPAAMGVLAERYQSEALFQEEMAGLTGPVPTREEIEKFRSERERKHREEAEGRRQYVEAQWREYLQRAAEKAEKALEYERAEREGRGEDGLAR
ncbi:helix-turn-helix domain-containing protein [Streptomyces sp. NPDC020983]|uniref:helix-turn-helix domain-containing protein n=1 Tax=Streptomyces sp. NPDC020983 TaxID=3365106 RepID=UPI0037AAEDCE